MPRLCPNCLRPIPKTHHKGRKYCKDSCRNNAYRRREKKKLITFNYQDWLFIPGFENLYRVSKNGLIFSERSLKVMSGCIKNGYPFVNIRKDSRYIGMYIHRAIALAYIPNPDNKPCINHKDGDRANSIFENLEWCTYSENIRHRDNALGYVYPIKKK